MATPRALVRSILTSAAGVLLVDQASKTIVRVTMALCRDDPVEVCHQIAIAGPLGLIRTENAASALGLSGGWTLLPLLVASFVLLAAQGLMVRPTFKLGVGLGLQLGGLLANLVDRVAYGAVTDFINIALDAGRVSVVANPADIALVVGGAMTTTALLRASGRQRSAPDP